MRYQSIITTRGVSKFPEFLGERIYMREFYKDKGLPEDISRWQDTVDTLLDGVDTDQPIYLMVDEKFVPAGEAQRRKGLHIDGYWNPGISAHGHSGGHGGHSSQIPSGHSAYRGHGSRPVEEGRHGGIPAGRHFSGKWDGPSPWLHADFLEPEGLILSSSVSAARGYVGEFNGEIGEGGDCSHIDLSGLTEIPMEQNVVYAGNVTCLHESIPVKQDCYRQLIRLNVPGWTP